MKSILKRNQIMITALAIMIAIAGYLNFAGNKIDSEELVTTNGDSITNEAVGITDDISLEGEDSLQSALDISDADNIQDELVEIESLDTDINMAETDLPDGGDALAAADTDTALPVDGSAAAANPTADGEIPGEAVFTSTSSVNTLSGAKLLKEQTRAKNKETLLEIINSKELDNTQKQQAIDNMISLTDTAEKETAAEILLETKGFSDAVVSISKESVDVIVNASELSDAKRAQIEDIVKRKTGVAAENIIITPMGSK